MSELLANLALGFKVASNPLNILFCLIGALVVRHGMPRCGFCAIAQ